MMRYVYQARIEADGEGGFVVTFPDVPEAITAGETRIEALANASDALGSALRGYLAEGRSLPSASMGKAGLIDVPVETVDALKLALIEAFAASELSKSELARRLGKAENEARRLLDPDHRTKIALLEAALGVLGKQVIVSVRDAA